MLEEEILTPPLSWNSTPTTSTAYLGFEYESCTATGEQLHLVETVTTTETS
jgi:hypothetical protein